MRLSNIAPALQTKDHWDKYTLKNWMSTSALRRAYITEHAWCILTTECAAQLGKYLSNFSNVIEVFAGTGYIASHLREASGLGRKYRAYDGCRSHWNEAKRPNYGFTKSGCFNINLKKADCIVMSWPNYNENLAYRIVRKMVPGQRLIYQGEGNGGCTGDDKFHTYLRTNFRRVNLREEMINRVHARWEGMYDEWHILIKNEKAIRDPYAD